MVHLEYWLPNDNVVIWIGQKDTSDTSNPSENALILAEGDVLLFRTKHKISLRNEKSKKELLELSRQEYETKHGIDIEYEMWAHLKEKIQSSTYPPFQNKSRITEYSKMVNNNHERIDNLLDEVQKKQYYKELILTSLRKINKKTKNDVEKIFNIPTQDL